ncbi:MAG: alpha-L-fucosidase [Dysgonamonadaceae bacterium]|jgi:hypothetical protein|nr:alpha-L-fucosidase [Dysgonamonadaceae bacterium]
MKKLSLTALAIAICCALFSAPKITTGQINWQKFLEPHAFVWDSIRTDYYAGAIMGNGLLGANLYKNDENSYRFDVGRVDVTENRGRIASGYSRSHLLFDEARLPIGYFTLHPAGKVKSDSMRLSIYEAVATGVIVTDKGKINFKTYVHAQKNIILLETDSEGAETEFRWSWTPLRAVSPRLLVRGTDEIENSDYLKYPNPAVKEVIDGDYQMSVQPLYCGLTYAVAWKEVRSGSKRRIAITISQEDSETEAIAAAKQNVGECFSINDKALEKSHKKWWKEYYTASFATFTDKNLESFYWRQVYKLACATRPDKMIIDLQGPWAVQRTPWPAIWFNLNTQLTYSWEVTANRQAFTRPLWKALNENIENLHKNVVIPDASDAIGLGRSGSYGMFSVLNPRNADKNQYEVGNLTWILFYYWQYCTYTADNKELVDRFYPLLKAAVNYYFHIRTVGSDGKYHLPPTASPEYTSASSGGDVNYDLALLRWGLATLLEIDSRFALKDAKRADWQDFLGKLADYPTDEHGFRISATLGFDYSHRHYSHLLMIYPLYLVNWEQPENQNIIAESIRRWMSLPGALQGYSFTGSSSMYASTGDGERAVKQLQTLLAKYIQFNTLYKESGPVFETPMAAAASLQDLYIQSWGGKIRVFPAVPDSWKEAEFINFRTEGAFLVSAKRKDGKTSVIQVESEAGGLCRIQTGMDANNLKISNLKGKNTTFSVIENGVIEFETEKGGIYLIIAK